MRVMQKMNNEDNESIANKQKRKEEFFTCLVRTKKFNF